MRIPLSVFKAYLRRGAATWLLMRLCVSAVLLMGREDPLRLSPATVVVLIAATVVLTWTDIQRRHERLLIGNLGFTPASVSCLALLPAAAGEIAIGIIALAST